ncbi:MAG: hypothetical protein EBT51_08355 [Flavobacteriaceae bacterium]|nr:hypothetical protein [Flavobacteriaceae bacterium]
MNIKDLELETIDCVDDHIVNVYLNFNTGKNYFEGGMSVNATLELDDGNLFVDSIEVESIEDEDEKEVALAYDLKELKNKIEGFLYNVLHYTRVSNTNESELIKAIS